MPAQMRLALALSIGIHSALFVGWPASTAVQFDVERAPSSLEVFVLAPPPPAQQTPTDVAPQPTPPVRIIEDPLTPEPLQVQTQPESPEPTPSEPTPPAPSAELSAPLPTPVTPEPAPQPIVSELHHGVLMDALPGYLRNPAPRYPRLARERGEEGTVLVEVDVLSSGRPSQVVVHTSSGFLLLDRAAVSAIERWTFNPAKRLGQPVAASVRIPVTFRLIDR